MVDYLKDRQFLMKLNAERLQYKYAKLQVLDFDENPTGTIEGKCTAGTINVSNQSQMRRTGSITFIVEENKTYDFASVNNLLNLNTKIKVWIGLENHIDATYDDMIWFPQGVFVITDLSIQNSLQGLTVSLNIKDKMCLLNGECGGTLPASVTFNTYNQQNTDGSVTIIENPILDIIHTLVVNFGGENYDKVAVNDISKRIKQLCRWNGSMTLYVDTSNGIYTTEKPNGYDASDTTTWSSWRNYEAGENVGYRYVDFVYPVGSDNSGLVSSIGDTVVTVLNKIIEKIGNYEFFYDINGNFIWQEKKNYLNTTYDETHILIEKITNSNGTTSWDYSTDTSTNYYTWGLNSSIINNKNYMVSFNTSSYPQYNFTQGNNIVSAYTNKLNYANIRNDYQIWGKNSEGSAIHYHLAVKSKPNKPYVDITTGEPCYKTRYIVPYRDANGTPTGIVRLAQLDPKGENNGYESGAVARIPQDWREEIYYEGLETIEKGQRPDMITQEILDLFDSSYNMFEQKFKISRTGPNSLTYYIDFLEPYGPMSDYSINGLNLKTYTTQSDSIVRIYDVEAPDYVLVGETESISPNEEDQYLYEDDGTPIISGRDVMLRRAELSGDTVSRISDSLKSKIYENIIGYSAQEYARDLLYQHTNYAESITLETTPIFHLEPNTTIQVYDKDSGISGDYVIDSFSIDLSNSGSMSIEATKSLKRI